jgi:hypothetical protein
MISDIEGLFLYLLAIGSSFDNCSLAIFKSGYFFIFS